MRGSLAHRFSICSRASYNWVKCCPTGIRDLATSNIKQYDKCVCFVLFHLVVYLSGVKKCEIHNPAI